MLPLSNLHFFFNTTPRKKGYIQLQRIMTQMGYRFFFFFLTFLRIYCGLLFYSMCFDYKQAYKKKEKKEGKRGKMKGCVWVCVFDN